MATAAPFGRGFTYAPSFAPQSTLFGIVTLPEPPPEAPIAETILDSEGWN